MFKIIEREAGERVFINHFAVKHELEDLNSVLHPAKFRELMSSCQKEALLCIHSLLNGLF